MHDELEVGPGELPGYQFRTTINGYDRREVDTLLHAVAANWERQRRAHEVELAAARGGQSAESPRKQAGSGVGDGVEAILERAREVGDEIVEEARAEREAAAQLVRDAEARAAEIVAGAADDAQRARLEAEAEYEDLLERTSSLRERLRSVLAETTALVETLPGQHARAETPAVTASAARSAEHDDAASAQHVDPDAADTGTEQSSEARDDAPAEVVVPSSGLRRLLHQG